MTATAMVEMCLASPAVPSESVGLLSEFRILPALTDLTMMQLFSGWQPTTFTFGLYAADTLATPETQTNDHDTSTALRHNRWRYTGLSSLKTVGQCERKSKPLIKPPPPTGTKTASSSCEGSCASSSKATVPCPPAIYNQEQHSV